MSKSRFGLQGWRKTGATPIYSHSPDKIDGCLSSELIISIVANKVTRRRLHHGDVDGRKNEYVDDSKRLENNQPLLETNNAAVPNQGPADGNKKSSEDKKKEVNLHWTLVLSNLTLQWSGWFANIAIRSFIGRMLPSSSAAAAISLSPMQEARLRKLRERLKVKFNGSNEDHQNALKQLWQEAYPDRETPPLKSELWKEMGWQGIDPTTDFRGGGFISLENLIFFAKNYPESFQALLHKKEGKRTEWEYPFAVAGINVSFMLTQMLDLQSEVPSSKVGIRFLELLGDDEKAFDELYCLAFRLLDVQWLERRASYMEFKEVMKSTISQLERELTKEDIASIKDLPSYIMLI